MNKKILLAIVFIVLILVVIFFVQKKDTGSTLPKPSSDFKNATYEIDEKQITLKDGTAETEIEPGSISRIMTEYFGNEAHGDLNGDGTEDVAFILTQDTGGSGIFFYVVVALLGENGYTGTNATSLGDRIAPQTTEINGGQLVVNYADRKEGDSMLDKPSVNISKYLKVVNDKLQESVKTSVTSTPITLGAPATPAPATTPATTPATPPSTPPPGPTVYTMAQVQSHNSQASCYTTIRGNVYDLTSWIGQHPGGQSAIMSICGKDGTSAFEGQHGDQPRPNNELDGFLIGVLAK